MTRIYSEEAELYDLACYDGREEYRPRVELERDGGLLWDELVAP